RIRAPHTTALDGDRPLRGRNHSLLIRSLPCTTRRHKFTKGNAMRIRALAIVTALALPTIAIADDQPKTPEQTPPADKAPADRTPTDMTNEKTTNAPTKTPAAPGKSDKAAKLSDGDVKIIAHLHHVNQ